jgi:hypothetical protein
MVIALAIYYINMRGWHKYKFCNFGSDDLRDICGLQRTGNIGIALVLPSTTLSITLFDAQLF